MKAKKERCDGCKKTFDKGTLRRDDKDAALLYCPDCPKVVEQYEVRGWHKDTEEDVFSDGCQIDLGNSSGGDERWEHERLYDLITMLMAFVGTTDDAHVLLDSCDDVGRVDIQVYETITGVTACEDEMRMWRRGQIRLWLCTYIFHIEHVTREPVRLLNTTLALTYKERG